jgi:hypothetical protein
MIVLDTVDGKVADGDGSVAERCLCDLEAVFISRLALGRAEFESGARRLPRRREARAAFVTRWLLDRGRGRFACVDEEAAFAANDEFEEMFGREPLESLVNDTEEIIHQRLGTFFSGVEGCGAMTSPMTAGKAFSISPARSFEDAAALSDFRRGRNSDWSPSIRTEIKFVIAGSVGAVAAAVAGFVPAMAGCGVLARMEQRTRRPDLAGIPHRAPMLAAVAGNGPREAGHMQ